MARTPAFVRGGAACLALLSAAPGASAFDFFPGAKHDKKHCFDKHCDSTRVVIPSRQVEVVNERPQVIVRDAPTVTRTVRTHHAPTVGVAPIPITTVYMPLTLPAVTAFPAVGAPPCRDTVEAGPGPLDLFHKAEQAQFQAQVQAEKARVELQATVALQQRVAARLNTPLTSGGGTPDTTSTDRRLTELADQMRALTDRVNSVEKLLVTHHNVIRERILSKTSDTSSTDIKPIVTPVKEDPKPTIPMIPPLPER